MILRTIGGRPRFCHVARKPSGSEEGSHVQIEELARQRFGFTGLRAGQLRAVEAAVAGRDVLAVLPTGSGKSAIYELAGMVRDGPTVVVSPLIALQDDQLAHLRAAGLTAIVLNSHQSSREHAAALAASCGPDAFVFLSPEQLAKPETRDVLRHARPGLFAVDEAHLISQWGRDFRTDYMRLGAQADALGVPVRMALTATAAPPIRAEISRRLGLRDPEVVVGDFDRPYIQLAARRVQTVRDKDRELEQAAAELDGPGIVYAATHAAAQDAHDVLAASGHSVALYHAGLTPRVRREAMASYLDGSARIISATVAFGMGIDKPDVRWVLHVDPPASLDAYYQEFGRAGRDGDAAVARLVYRVEDFGAAAHFSPGGVSRAAVARVAELVASGAEVAPTRETTAALVRLADLGAAAWDADGRVRWTGDWTVDRALAASTAETRRENEVSRSQLEMMRRYAEHGGCRRSFMLTYFGQDYPGPCGNCDNDLAGAVAPITASEPYPVGGRVRSERWGDGTVQRYDGDQMTVLFDDHGYRDLSVPITLERRLLRGL
jgi:ATP-dependent DNA helicase RecQ